jgi:hypothetical protein
MSFRKWKAVMLDRSAAARIAQPQLRAHGHPWTARGREARQQRE